MLCNIISKSKEYFKYFKSQSISKKHKGIKEVSAGMDYKNYAERIKPLFDFKTFRKPKLDDKNVARIANKKSEMTTFMIKKKKFSQLNDKGFYFLNAVVSLPFGHLSLTEIDEYKKIKVGESKSTFGLKKKNF